MSDISLIKKLDLDTYIETFQKFLARAKDIPIQGDINIHYRYIKELSNVDFTPPKESRALEVELNRLKKQALLSLEDIFEFVKIIRYFRYLRTLTLPHLLREWMEAIVVPDEIMGIIASFDDEGRIDPNRDSELLEIDALLKNNKIAIRESLKRIVNQKRLQEFLVDSQIHYVNDEETILVRGGFSGVIKASVIARSGAGVLLCIAANSE